MKSGRFSPESCWYLTTCSFQALNCCKKEAGWVSKLGLMRLDRSLKCVLLLLVVCSKLSCLQASQPFVDCIQRLTWSWVSPLVFWTRRCPSCRPSFCTWSLLRSSSCLNSNSVRWSASRGASSFKTSKAAASSSGKLARAIFAWSTRKALWFSFKTSCEAFTSPSSSICTLEAAVCPRTSYKTGLVWLRYVLISSAQAWKLSRSSRPPSKTDGWRPFGPSMAMCRIKAEQLPEITKMPERKLKVMTRSCLFKSSATMLSSDNASCKLQAAHCLSLSHHGEVCKLISYQKQRNLNNPIFSPFFRKRLFLENWQITGHKKNTKW